jgi:hypothetical protein
LAFTPLQRLVAQVTVETIVGPPVPAAKHQSYRRFSVRSLS